MNYKVQLTTEAEDDIRSIFEYIAFNLHSVQNAVGQIDRLEKACRLCDKCLKGLNHMKRNHGTAVICTSCR